MSDDEELDALLHLFNQDDGPPKDADEERRREGAEAWLQWLYKYDPIPDEEETDE